MSTELTIKGNFSPLDISRITNAALLKETKSLDALQSKMLSGANNLIDSIETIRREQSIILDRIQSTKLYEKDGFKSLAEYAETIGLNKANAHSLASAGRIYNDKTAPDALKALSPSKLATLSSAIKADKDTVYTDAEQGKFNDATQSQLKDYARDRAAKSTKGKVVKTYTATRHNSTGGASDIDMSPMTIDEWEAHYKEIGEVCALPKAYASVDADKPTLIRYLIIPADAPYYIVVLHEAVTPKASKVKVSKSDPRTEILRRLASRNASYSEVCDALNIIGYDPIAEPMYAQLVADWHKLE